MAQIAHWRNHVWGEEQGLTMRARGFTAVELALLILVIVVLVTVVLVQVEKRQQVRLS